MRRDRPSGTGFTLIEMVIVIVVLGIMAAMLSPLVLSSLRAYDDTLDNVIVLDKLRYATERLAREIREVNYSGGSYQFDGTYTSGGMGTNSMKFVRSYYDSSIPPGVTTRDVTITGTPADGAVKLEYSDMTSTGTGPQVLADDLSSLAFAYFDADGHNATTSPSATVTASNVRFVEITLTLSPQNGQPYVQRTRVELRNRS